MRMRLLMSRLFLAVFLCGLVLPAAAQSPVEPAAVRPDLPYYFEDFEASNGGYASVGDHPWTWGRRRRAWPRPIRASTCGRQKARTRRTPCTISARPGST